jgi:hypothetical protein
VEASTFSLDSWLTDGDKIVSLTRWLPFIPQELGGGGTVLHITGGFFN